MTHYKYEGVDKLIVGKCYEVRPTLFFGEPIYIGEYGGFYDSKKREIFFTKNSQRRIIYYSYAKIFGKYRQLKECRPDTSSNHANYGSSQPIDYGHLDTHDNLGQNTFSKGEDDGYSSRRQQPHVYGER